jgi:O-antigen ligase
MRAKFREAFFAWGWLLPAYLPAAYLLGRAVFTILAALGYLWAALSLYDYRLPVERRIQPGLLLGYAALLGTALLSALLAQNHQLHSLWCWFDLLLFSLAGCISAWVLRGDPQRLSKLLRAWNIGALAMLVILGISLATHIQQPGFNPAHHMFEDDLALVTPFLLYGIHSSTLRFRRSLSVALVTLITVYIIFSQGRATLLGLAVAILAYLVLVLAWRPKKAAIVSAFILSIAIGLSGGGFWRESQDSQSLVESVDALTSGRSALWRHAIANPPPNTLTGVGIGNLRHAGPAVLSFRLDHPKAVMRVSHLHNFLLDAWYETGLLGLAALLLWLLILYRLGFKAWRAATDETGAQIGVLLAASLSITTSALLSYSYGSREWAIYMYVFLLSAASLAPNRNHKSLLGE